MSDKIFASNGKENCRKVSATLFYRKESTFALNDTSIAFQDCNINEKQEENVFSICRPAFWHKVRSIHAIDTIILKNVNKISKITMAKIEIVELW